MSDHSKIPRPSRSMSSFKSTRIPSVKPRTDAPLEVPKPNHLPSRQVSMMSLGLRSKQAKLNPPRHLAMARTVSSTKMLPAPPSKVQTRIPEPVKNLQGGIIQTKQARVQTENAQTLSPFGTAPQLAAPPRTPPSLESLKTSSAPPPKETPFLPRMPAAWRQERLQDTSFELDDYEEELARTRKELAELRKAKEELEAYHTWDRIEREADSALQDAEMIRRMIKIIRDGIQDT